MRSRLTRHQRTTFLWASGLSTAGSFAGLTAKGWLLMEGAHNPLLLALNFALLTLPTLLVSGAAGVLTDRIGSERVLIRAQWALFAAAAALGLAACRQDMHDGPRYIPLRASVDDDGHIAASDLEYLNLPPAFQRPKHARQNFKANRRAVLRHQLRKPQMDHFAPFGIAAHAVEGVDQQGLLITLRTLVHVVRTLFVL